MTFPRVLLGKQPPLRLVGTTPSRPPNVPVGGMNGNLVWRSRLPAAQCREEATNGAFVLLASLRTFQATRARSAFSRTTASELPTSNITGTPLHHKRSVPFETHAGGGFVLACGGSVWVRFSWGNRVFGRATAENWVRLAYFFWQSPAVFSQGACTRGTSAALVYVCAVRPPAAGLAANGITLHPIGARHGESDRVCPVAGCRPALQ